MRTAKRLIALAAVLAVAALGTATAAADDWQAEFNAAGWISYVSGSGGTPSSTAEFEIVDDEITAVTIDASNQMIVGSVTDLSVCIDGNCGNSHNNQFVAVNSYHIELLVTEIETRTFTRPSPNGDVPAEAEVIHGLLTGTLDAEFESGYGSGGMAGVLDLRALGYGQFVCFAPQMGPLSECIDGPGQLLPVGLDIIATGPFEVDITGPSYGNGSVHYSGDLAVDFYAMADLGKIAHNDPRAITASGIIMVETAVKTYQ